MRYPFNNLIQPLLFPTKKFLDIAVPELHPGRPAMVALAGMGSDFHFAKQRVHFGDREDAAGAHGTVARHRRGDVIELFLERHR